MSALAAVASVQSRIASLETRFGTPTSQATPGQTASTVGTAPTVDPTMAPTSAFPSAESGFSEVFAQALGADTLTDAARPASNPFGGGTTALPAGTPYAAEFAAAGERYGISPTILAAVGYVESSYRPDAVSSAGAIGVMQLMPATAASLGVAPTNPASAIDGAARMLSGLRDRFGSIELALGAYNVGPGAIANAGGITPGSQAERYVNKVLATEQGMR